MQRKIRLIELFAGYGSQAIALNRLGLDFHNYKISEWNVKSNSSYYALHNYNDTFDYSSLLSDEEIIKYLENMKLTLNDKDCITYNVLKRKGITYCRKLYNELISNHNLGNIKNVSAKDINIEETDKYIYMLTYSFPCVDISSSGKRQGMKKGNNTRSGLLWEVERILNEIKSMNKELPQILFMENVKQIVSDRYKEDFNNWCSYLESLGYKNSYKVLNSTDYGIPQSRERCFMISILNGKEFIFPDKIELTTYIRDYLENIYTDKHTISNEYTKDLLDNYKGYNPYENNERFKRIVVLGNYTKSNYESSKIVDINGILPTIKDNHNTVVAILEDKRVRRLTAKEFGRMMGLTDEEIDRVLRVNSMSTARKQFGNSIVVNIMVSIFRELFNGKYI